MSGKMGNAVFRARSGQQVVTQYNPIVANPNTVAQQGSRARFKLVAQLAVVFSSTIKGFGTMGVTKRTARTGRNPRAGVNAAFVGINYPITVLDPDPTAAEKAMIPMEKVQLTSSNRPFGSMVLSQEGGATAPHIEVTINAPSMRDGDKVKVVLVGYGTMGVTKSPYVINTYDGTIDDGEAVVVTDKLQPTEKYTVLAFGVSLDAASVSRLALANMQSEEDFLAEVGIDTLLKSGAGSATATIGENITISAGA